MLDIEKIAAKAKSQLPPKAEPKGAAPAPSAEIKKTEEEVKKAAQDAEVKKVADEKATKEAKAKDIEAQAKKDEEILSKKEEELDEPAKKRKAELVKIKQDAEDKEKKSNVQKRFDELTSKIKALEADRDSTKAEKESVKAELDGIKKQLSMTPQDKIKEKVKGELASRQKKYLEEDKSLLKAERREMTKEDLDEWALEDYEGAQEWVAKRTYRRIEEEKQLKTDEDLSQKADHILNKQHESAQRTYANHPELNITARTQELMKSGKSKEEIVKILSEENPKYKAVIEIYREDPNKYMLSEDAPELIVAEMEKRIGKPKEDKQGDEREALEKKLAELEAENATLKGLDTSIGSTRDGKPPVTETDLENKQAELSRKLGLDPARVKKRVADRIKEGIDG